MYTYQTLIHEKIRRTWLELGNSLPDTLHHAGALVAQNYREDPLRIRATEGVGVGVTDPCSHDLRIKTSNLMFSFSSLGTAVCFCTWLSVFALQTCLLNANINVTVIKNLNYE